MKIKELLSDKTKWTKFYLARDKNGTPVGCDDVDAVCWCLWGAYYHCYSDYNFEKGRLLINANATTVWNDAPERTFEEIKELVEKLDI